MQDMRARARLHEERAEKRDRHLMERIHVLETNLYKYMALQVP